MKASRRLLKKSPIQSNEIVSWITSLTQGDDERPEIQTKKLRKCTVISGDGIGPEMMEAVYRVFEVTF